VWPYIIINKERAVKTRQATIEFFDRCSQYGDHPLAKMAERVRTYNSFNTWENIFDATTTRPKVGLRLPFCDKRSRLPDLSWRDEHRPVLPTAELIFEFDRSAEDPTMEICTRVLTGDRVEQKWFWEWARLGMCRRPSDGARAAAAAAAARPAQALAHRQQDFGADAAFDPRRQEYGQGR